MENDKAKGSVADTPVKLTSEEITKLAMEHTRIVEAFAAKFDGHYLDWSAQLEDYREWLEEMEDHLTRAEELVRTLGGTEDAVAKAREEKK